MFNGRLQAQNNTEEAQAHTKILNERAKKILSALSLTDSLKYNQLKDIIIAQYHNLNIIYDERNEQLKPGTANRLLVLHKEYLAQLSALLDNDQVNNIKDGMTYGVLPVTYKAYQEMIPTLKDEEKAQILTWLLEARELAMDAGSSEEKHRIFGKYKGRVNNYLSARGYDLQKEREAWEERKKKSPALPK